MNIRRGGRVLAAVALAAVALVTAGLLAFRASRPVLAPPPILFEPTVVYATLRLDGALVRGAAANWAMNRGARLRYGDPVPVLITAYCLKGRTRRDRYVREGIVAADPRLFPLARYLEIYVGKAYWGRFLIDDTGKRIKGNRLDIWTATCPQARTFGSRRGIAVLVPRPRGAGKDTLLTGRLGGKARK
ncbi:MAG: hypothetical protein JWM95_3236 [Gemmatimonadetes bacterium]|nr:hypothetical protein [Gemmatimonadota bacterium]